MARGKSRRRAPKRGWGGRIVGWAVRLVLLFVVGSLAWVVLYRFVPPPITFTQLGDVAGGRSLSRDWTPLAGIDRDMVRAAIAAEDGKFCSHRGFDTDAIAAAMRRNAEGGRIRGGSTISQQTAKNAFLWQSGGYFRKGLEAWFTLLIEQIWGKRRIMEVYLNVAETGIGTYGVEAGAQRYFGKSAADLTRQQAARIAAVLPLPKKRGAVAPKGFTRRYGNSVAARIGVVARDGLDACVYQQGTPAPAAPADEPAPQRRKAAPAAPRAPAAPVPERVEDYIDPADAAPPTVVEIPIEQEAPPAVEAPPLAEINGL